MSIPAPILYSPKFSSFIKAKMKDRKMSFNVHTSTYTMWCRVMENEFVSPFDPCVKFLALKLYLFLGFKLYSPRHNRITSNLA